MGRELPPPEELLKPRDEDPIIIVPPQTWDCLMCRPVPRSRLTSVIWSGPATDGPHGRCSDCGQKYVLSNNYGMKFREGLPVEYLGKREYFCDHWPTKTNPEKGINVSWKKEKGHCEDCGQNFRLEA